MQWFAKPYNRNVAGVRISHLPQKIGCRFEPQVIFFLADGLAEWLNAPDGKTGKLIKSIAEYMRGLQRFESFIRSNVSQK